jgi:glutamyl-tRNA synthetase
MEITHVIRGEEWISSTPKHLLLYRAFGWTPPQFVHLPLLRNPDKSKLSKRKNPTGILYYRRAGFLPKALINFLGLMAYSPADGEETFSLQKMVETFDIDRMSLGGPIFDLQKLQAFNGRYIRDLSESDLLQQLQEWMLNDETMLKLMPLAQPRLNQLTDFMPMTSFIFSDKLEYDCELLLKADEEPARATALLRIVQWEIEKMSNWNAEAIKDMFTNISEKEDIKFKKLLSLFFVAITGKKVSLPLFDTMEVIGRDMRLRRIQYAVDLLEQNGLGMGKKKLKKLTKDYTYRYSKS